MKLNLEAADVRRYKTLLYVLVGLFAVQLVAGCIIIYFVSIAQTKSFINHISNLAHEDILYKNGTWDTSRYDSDPEIPGNYRIYVISKDGFVIDRWRPIPGYLDTSDFKQLLTYRSPRSIHTITDQNWRIYSLPINDSRGSVIGLIAVGRYGDREDFRVSSDNELIETARQIRHKITVEGSEIDTEDVNIHDVPFETSFQIVDQYNRIHLKSDNSNTIDRLPNYIDPSYITNQLRTPSLQTVKAAKTGESFLLQSSPIYDNHQIPVGTVIVARTISPYLDLIRNFAVINLLAAIIIIPAGYGVLIVNSKKRGGQPIEKLLKLQDIKTIKFDKKASEIKINNQKIAVSYSTNQYYMCAALFGSPKKKWETDDLIEKFGMDHGPDSWRKIYDAMVSINKKASSVVDSKLIISNNKTYQINPDYVVKVT